MSLIFLFITFTFISLSFTTSITPDYIESSSTSEASATTSHGSSSSTAISSSTTSNINELHILSNDSSILSTGFFDSIFPQESSYQTIINPDTTFVIGQCKTSKWTTTSQQGIAISSTSHGELYAVNLQGELMQYHFPSNQWKTLISNQHQIMYITSISASTYNGGSLFIITSSGETFMITNLINNNKHQSPPLIKLPGCAIDIAVNNKGDIYKIGCDKVNNGFGVYKLIYDNDNHNFSKSKWFKIEGSGVRVAVNANDELYTVGLNGDISMFSNENGKWWVVASNTKARNISIGNDNNVYYTDVNMHIFKINVKEFKIEQICGLGKGVTVGPFGKLIIIDNAFNILISTKEMFN